MVLFIGNSLRLTGGTRRSHRSSRRPPQVKKVPETDKREALRGAYSEQRRRGGSERHGRLIA